MHRKRYKSCLSDPCPFGVLQNDGFCNGCITKRNLLLQSYRLPKKCFFRKCIFIFCPRILLKLDYYMTHFLGFAICKRLFVMQPFKNPVLCSCTVQRREGAEQLLNPPDIFFIKHWGRIHGRNWNKSLKSFLLAIHSHRYKTILRALLLWCRVTSAILLRTNRLPLPGSGIQAGALTTQNDSYCVRS